MVLMHHFPIFFTDSIFMIVKDWCSFCGECAGVCPINLIQVREYSLVFNDGDCKDCDTCIKACPIDALEKEE